MFAALYRKLGPVRYDIVDWTIEFNVPIEDFVVSVPRVGWWNGAAH